MRELDAGRQLTYAEVAVVDLKDIDARARDAVSQFWRTRQRQARKQRDRGGADQGARSAVTGGAQMDGFVGLVASLVRDAGVPEAAIFRKRRLELPGFFRPTKKWDMLVVVDGELLAVVELKSQVGPSFGNNFNNRMEEALGSAMDLWTAYRDDAFWGSPRPWLGYLFLLEDCDKTRNPVSVREPHFKVFGEFRGASYSRRYELLCRKLVRERHYEAAAFLTSNCETGLGGDFREPAKDLTLRAFAGSLSAHVSTYAAVRGTK